MQTHEIKLFEVLINSRNTELLHPVFQKQFTEKNLFSKYARQFRMSINYKDFRQNLEKTLRFFEVFGIYI